MATVGVKGLKGSWSGS